MASSHFPALSSGQLLILISSSMGQILGAVLSAVVGLVLPLLQMNPTVHASSASLSCVASSGLLGITAGSAVIGKVSTRFAPLIFLRIGPLIATAASLSACFCKSIPALCTALFVIGFTVGGEYSLDSETVSKCMGKSQKNFMVGAVKAASALGSLFGALTAFLLLEKLHSTEAAGNLFLIIALPAFLTFLLRLLISGKTFRETSQSTETAPSSLLKGNGIARIVFCGIPWACEGAAVYGVGIFLPTLLMTLMPAKAETAGFDRVLNSAELSVLISTFVLAGFALGLYLIGKLSSLKLQTGGFLIAAAGLLILFAAQNFRLPGFVCLIGFLIFEIALNAGPHLMTYVLPNEIYPVSERSEGAGIAAAVGKLGAVISVISIPFLLEKAGAEAVLLISAVLLLVGAAVTGCFGRKLLGRKNEEPGDNYE